MDHELVDMCCAFATLGWYSHAQCQNKAILPVRYRPNSARIPVTAMQILSCIDGSVKQMYHEILNELHWYLSGRCASAIAGSLDSSITKC
jgi:hypothetical protein